MKNTVQFKIKKSLFMQQVSQNIRRGSYLCQAIYSLFSQFILFEFSSLWFPSLWPHELSDLSHSHDLITLKFLQEMHCSLNISCSMPAINTPVSATSLNARDSEANGLFVTLSSFFHDQHIEPILFILLQRLSILQASIGSIWIANNIQTYWLFQPEI